MPDGIGFLWRPDVVALHVVTDSLVAFSYFCISVLLLTFTRRRPALRRFGWLCSSFIISCGLTHGLDIWTIWHADYWLAGAFKAVSAIAALATVAALSPLMPYARALLRFTDADWIDREPESRRQVIVEGSNDGAVATIADPTQARHDPLAPAKNERDHQRLAEAMAHPVRTADPSGPTGLASETRSVLDTLGQIISITDGGSFDYLSPSWALYTGMGIDFGASSDWRHFIHPDDLEGIDCQVCAIRESALRVDQCEIRVRARDGSYRWFLARSAGLTETGSSKRRVTIWTDIDDLKRAQAALGDSETRHRALTESMPQMVWIADEHLKIQFVNDRWLSFTGLTFEPGMPSKTISIVHPDDVATLAAGHEALRGRTNLDCEMRLRRHDGVYRWHLVQMVQFRETAEAVMQSIVTATDIEARKSAEAALAHSAAELTHRAHHDALTDLPNRRELIERLAVMIAAAKADGGGVAVLYLDIDHFKTVNDTLGHNAGDQLLIETAARIRSTLRAEDTASRMGGDEFVLVCVADGVAEAASIAERLQAAVREPIELHGKRVVVASSIGISLYPTDGATPADLMQRADAAMYAAKQSGRDAWSFYSEGTSPAAVPALDLEIELREAIAREEFVVYYQPIIEIGSGRAIGAEALVRWAHPKRGLLAPGEFIAFAEDHGMIGPIGELVLNATCAQIRRMKFRAGDDFSIAVNVSARQFAKPSFVGSIAAAIARHGIEARRLEIEITETVVMADTAVVIATLDRLQRLGVRLSMDDFGTGYSSLAYIKNFPIHTLKIDRSFVADVALNFTDQAIAKTIVTLAHSLGMRTVAEGVEAADQLDRLRSFGADCFQGYLACRPLPAPEFEAFVKSRRSATARTA